MAFPRMLYAHRGAPAERPENTLPSFHRAVELGVDAIETDVHMTRDGHVVIAHDPTARRMAGVDVAWRDIDITTAKRFDLGWGFVAPDGTRPFAGQGIRIPTLEEALRACPDMRFNIDLKQAKPSMVGRVLELLHRHRAEERVTLASFQTATLLEVRRRGFGGDTAMAQAEVAAFAAMPVAVWRRLPFVASCAQVPVRAGPLKLASRWFIDKCHAAGIRVDFWTVNDPAEATRLFALGADGVMTDDPAHVRR